MPKGTVDDVWIRVSWDHRASCPSARRIYLLMARSREVGAACQKAQSTMSGFGCRVGSPGELPLGEAHLPADCLLAALFLLASGGFDR